MTYRLQLERRHHLQVDVRPPGARRILSRAHVVARVVAADRGDAEGRRLLGEQLAVAVGPGEARLGRSRHLAAQLQRLAAVEGEAVRAHNADAGRGRWSRLPGRLGCGVSGEVVLLVDDLS